MKESSGVSDCCISITCFESLAEKCYIWQSGSVSDLSEGDIHGAVVGSQQRRWMDSYIDA